MSEALKARVLEFTEEIWHKGNLDALGDFIAGDYVRHTNPGSRERGVDVHGIQDSRQSIAALRAAFPDIHFADDDTMADGDKVVAR
jgi:predicted ester cyclase